jgi:citrate lyase subunit beta/citryl-CoA lyase
MAARAARIAPLGLLNSLSNYTDLDALTRDVARSRAFGFVGAFCIHPRQVPALNNGFTPSSVDVVNARRVVAALDEAERQGLSSAGVDGRMIDVPVARRAREILRRATLHDRSATPD